MAECENVEKYFRRLSDQPAHHWEWNHFLQSRLGNEEEREEPLATHTPRTAPPRSGQITKLHRAAILSGLVSHNFPVIKDLFGSFQSTVTSAITRLNQNCQYHCNFLLTISRQLFCLWCKLSGLSFKSFLEVSHDTF